MRRLPRLRKRLGRQKANVTNFSAMIVNRYVACAWLFAEKYEGHFRGVLQTELWSKNVTVYVVAAHLRRRHF
jgi:hypothetical protein